MTRALFFVENGPSFEYSNSAGIAGNIFLADFTRQEFSFFGADYFFRRAKYGDPDDVLTLNVRIGGRINH